MIEDQYDISNQIVETMKRNNEKLIENNQRIEYLNFKLKEQNEMSDNEKLIENNQRIESIRSFMDEYREMQRKLERKEIITLIISYIALGISCIVLLIRIFT